MEDSSRQRNKINKNIRVIVICVIRSDDQIFVFEGRNELNDETFYRPLGGAVEFGEHTQSALQREFQEEIGTAIENLHFLKVIENMFTLEGVPGHEIVFIYEGDLVDKTLYDQSIIYGREDNGQPFKALWKSLADFGDGSPLYPDGLLELLKTKDANHF